jgi:tripeptide aminopeptidase
MMVRQARHPEEDQAIEKDRMTETFINLARIDSPSHHEREIAEKLMADLKALGGDCAMDDAGEKTGSNAGNILARFPGTGRGRPVLLSSHMDTVMPGFGVKPVREKDRIRSGGSTILGADDKSGLAIILEVLRVLKERKIPHPPVEIAFTICEELGLVGAKQMDLGRLTARDGLVLDSGPANSLFTRGPAADRFEARVRGVAAHAGVRPEAGISAIRVAAEAISKMRLGRIDPDTTANIGTIEGGTAVNIIPDRVVVHGEARSHDEKKLKTQSSHMAQCFHEAAAAHVLKEGNKTIQAEAEVKIERDYNRMNLGEDAPVVKWVRAAARAVGADVSCQKTGGGCDANVFNSHGLSIANLGTGMRNIHTTDEYLLLDEFFQTAQVILSMLQIAAKE